MWKNSSEVTTVEPSGSNPGITRGTEPLASTTASAVTVAVSPSLPTMRTVRSAPSEPRPENIVTLRPLRSPVTPAVSLSMTACLRSSVRCQSSDLGSTMTPKSPACLTVRTIDAVSSSSLAGMHPRCRQVPPILSNSTSATPSPAEAP